MDDRPRLIEHAFPLKQASLDSVHEKNVRHGHISTLHIWPARRPLAACRAALIATLLPDPSAYPKPEGMSDDEWHKEILLRRKELCEKIGGKVVKKVERKKMPSGQTVEREKEITEGGILHWGRETENKELLEWFRQEIRKAYGGRAPKVLDPFAGGGAIPLEAMRLGCEATAADINPVAWFILKCTLEYPQKLAGKTLPLPNFILENEEFMDAFYKAHPHLVGRTKKTKSQKERERLDPGFWDKPDSGRVPKADLAWHVRAWGQWVLDHARRELARYYPVYAYFNPLYGGPGSGPGSGPGVPAWQHPACQNKTGTEACPTREPMRLVPLKEDGTSDVDAMNKDFSKEYLADKRNPRWVAKPTVAYLWARTVQCKNCRATIPLLKTRWLCKKDKKRVLLAVEVVGQEVGSGSKDAFTIYQRKLPHWRMEGATYFLTWRLRQNQTELNPEERSLVVSTLRHFDGLRYRLLAYLVMNDHVHVLVEPLLGHDLSKITHSWKSFAAHQLQQQHGREGSIWQDESFDRIVRNKAEFMEKAQYIQNNPFNRWPDIKEYVWVGFPQWEQEMTGTEACPTRDSMPMDGGVGSGPGVPAWQHAACNKETGTEACPTIPRVVFGIEANVPIKGGNPAQSREHDKRVGAGTMSRSGATCPGCGAIMTMEDIRLEGQAGRLGAVMTAVVVDGPNGKEYRLPMEEEIRLAAEAEKELDRLFGEIPFGLPEEPLPSKEALGFRVPLYGFDQWRKLFTFRQLLALGTFVKWTRGAREELARQGYLLEWMDGIVAYLASMIDRLSNQSSNLSRWNQGGEKIEGTFARFALPILWDYAECNPLGETSGGYPSAFEWVTLAVDHLTNATADCPTPHVICQSAIKMVGQGVGQASVPGNTLPANSIDCIVTDPPYYDAIPYSDLMDYYYVWLRRTLNGLTQDIDVAFRERLSPKWNASENDGELIDDASRHGGDKTKSKTVYENGMAHVFQACHNALKPNGRIVIVFAHKHPDAWETLVSAIIRAGFVVDGSWPIQTERGTRARALSSAALASSVWLVCKKRLATAKPGWDNQVLAEMRRNIREKLREFWDAGIRGPDFVWAATGPALEAYSKHPVVKKANEPGPMTVSEFLTHVRRMVVDFVVGRVLSGPGSRPESGPGVPAWQHTAGQYSACSEEPGTEAWPTESLDEPTAYYLLHRHDFGLDEAPAGACILYAISCGVSDKELSDTWDLIGFTKGKSADEEPGTEAWPTESLADVDAEADPDTEEDSGSKVKLKTWAQRKGSSLGYEAPGGKPIPLIDRVHCLMHLWKAGDLSKVDEYLDSNGLRRQELFKRLLQSLIELSPHGSEERSLLESLSNHVQARGAVKDDRQLAFRKDE